MASDCGHPPVVGMPVMSSAVSSLPMRELAWRRVADDSHDLWCACMDWKAHVEYVGVSAELRPGSGAWPEQVEAQWRHQVHVAHDVWCDCGDWQGHALRSRSRTADSGMSSSSMSSYASAVSCPDLSEGVRQPWWKRLRVRRLKLPSWARRWSSQRSGCSAATSATRASRRSQDRQESSSAADSYS
ncbi:protein US1 [Panine betaherpesvirus 2]|uniref:Protein US1 n=1 Tax=Panine betaherpesvirus 2 TaxID=188763 RepID=Q8QRV6_9BETA|nr:protein US1 [Panine betaherpesvirus 2]AAM00782.1 protein US1 [Panine betaherpesvirus 2]